jgi:16S rRNA (cytosine1402-N4)-methyltransferase
MNNSNYHNSVMLDEVINHLAIKKDGLYIDATFGRGGHSLAILEKLGDEGRLIGLDQDITAIEYAQENIKDKRLIMVQQNFSQLYDYLVKNDLLGQVDGLLVDLGVSSPQLDNADRGFSFLREGPLDMRMNQNEGISVAQYLLEASEEEIANVLYQYGEEKRSRAIAKAIKEALPLTTTQELADVVSKVIPFNKHKHPATRTFQALRIFINKELDSLKNLLEKLSDILSVGGVFVAITFHSLEDRIVKQFINKSSKTISHPRGLPIMEKDIVKATFSKVTRLFASEAEISVNRRSRSAILRVCQKNN